MVALLHQESLCKPCSSGPCPATTHLLDKQVPLVQVQPVPQLQQHSVDWLVGTSSSLVGSEWCDDVYAEDLILEQPGQLGGANNCCRKGEK